MNVRFALAAAALVLAFLGIVAGLSAAAPDLKVEVTVRPANGTGVLTATFDARAVAVVTNTGNEAAGAFEVDLTAVFGQSEVVLRPHSLDVAGLAAGANTTLEDTVVFTAPRSGDVRVHATADPAGRVNDTARADNAANVTVHFEAPPAAATLESVASKSSDTLTLQAYAYHAFRIELRDGDSLIFQADSEAGVLFDCYLLDASNYARYTDAREHPATVGEVSFIRDYSGTSRDHIAFTAEPLPPGIYYLVLENDERLQSGAEPNGPVTIHYALAVVNNSLPAWAVIVVIGAAAASIWATVRWRPHFDVRSPLLEIPPPDLDEPDGPDGAGSAALPEGENGDGPPPDDEPEPES